MTRRSPHRRRDAHSLRSSGQTSSYWLLGGLIVVLVILWLIRPWLHGPLMFVYLHPLGTWVPLLIGLALAAVGYFALKERSSDPLPPALTLGGVAAALGCVVGLILTPGLQGHALYAASNVSEGASLPFKTQPRILPKNAAEQYGRDNDMRHAHLAVDPSSEQLVWTAEHKRGPIILRPGASDEWAIQPLDRLDGNLRRVTGGFDPAVSRVWPGSIKWRGYKKHLLTTITDYVLVPTPGGVVAIAPYLGYKGWFVKRPYIKGVYVYHQDGELEDLTLEEAQARPELAKSGRLIPESYARKVAEAYGYKTGSLAVMKFEYRTKVSDPIGNPQPYLTNFGDGVIKWVTVAHPSSHENIVSAIFLTDAVTGKTEVWQAPKNKRLLSNQGAVRVAHTLEGIRWERRDCCDADGYSYTVTLRTPLEPRPVFADGKFYYLVSIVPLFDSPTPVEKTIIVDPESGSIVKGGIFDHVKDDEADDRLREFFNADPPAPAPVPPGRTVDVEPEADPAT